MPTSNNNTPNDDRKPAARPSLPEFRSVAIARPQSLAVPGLRQATDDIDKASYFKQATQRKSDIKLVQSPTPNDGKKYSPWTPTNLRPVPAFYPLERSSRFVEDVLEVVVSRVSEANRLLSIHAVYCNKTATATLLTSENVEMHLSLWKTTGKQEGIVIEVQRRKGDSIAFHRYSRCILDSAAGELDIKDHVEKNGDDIDAVFSRKVQRLLTLEKPSDSAASEAENAIIAIEIAHGLVMKDRIDARQLGLESLCLLTDPKKTGYKTAVIASRVVLLGSAQDIDSNASPEEALLCDETPFQEIRQALLSLIQFRRIGDSDDFEEEDDSEESEHITVLHNLALAVLANALDVMADEDADSISSPEEVPAGRSRLDTSESISERFLEDSLECSDNREIMKTLITELGKASKKPHNACLSAKCIGSLCRASDKARKRAKELGAKDIVRTALEVGTRTHLKLERECSKVMSSLTETNTE
jgi:hypothetical protein